MLSNQELVEKTGMGIDTFVKRGATDFKFWAESLFGYKVKPFHLEWVDMFYNKDRSCVIAFRGCGKSTVLGVMFMLWISFYHHNKKMIIVSHNIRDSSKLIREMRKFINSVELLHTRLIPLDRSYSWTKTEINTATSCTILSKPYSDMARSDHVDYMLLDEASYFVDLTIYESVLLPMVLRHKGHIMVIGTPKTDADLLAKLKLPGSRYEVKEFPAVDKDGSPLWADIFPVDELEKLKKDQGLVAFAREYMLELRGSEEQAIKNDVILQSLDDTLILLNQRGEEAAKYFMGCDLALSPEGDFSVFTLVEKLDNGRYVLRSIDRYRGMDPESQARIIHDLYLKFKPLAIYVDESIFGKSLVTRLQTEYLVPAQPFKFDSYSRNSLVGMLVGIFNHPDGPRIIIPRNMNDAKTSMLTNELWKELTGIYPSRTKMGLDTYNTVTAHDDMVFSLALACRAAEDVKSPSIYIKSF